jgi:hypothetical protein
VTTCDLCREDGKAPRPVCLENCEATDTLVCNECYPALLIAGRFDRERDAEVYGYA